MKKLFFATILLLGSALLSQIAYAQYPKIPHDMQARADSIFKIEKHRSDLAFEKAMPAIKAGEKNGKPYIIWAAKPADLPQAKITAFPGAEGRCINWCINKAPNYSTL